LSAAVRWDWISSNPAIVAKKPRQPVPPTPEQAGKIVTAAWEQILTGARLSGWSW
jgi:hypothetical protein